MQAKLTHRKKEKIKSPWSIPVLPTAKTLRAASFKGFITFGGHPRHRVSRKIMQFFLSVRDWLENGPFIWQSPVSLADPYRWKFRYSPT
jgi:hypothetical protein